MTRISRLYKSSQTTMRRYERLEFKDPWEPRQSHRQATTVAGEEVDLLLSALTYCTKVSMIIVSLQYITHCVMDVCVGLTVPPASAQPSCESWIHQTYTVTHQETETIQLHWHQSSVLAARHAYWVEVVALYLLFTYYTVCCVQLYLYIYVKMYCTLIGYWFPIVYILFSIP